MKIKWRFKIRINPKKQNKWTPYEKQVLRAAWLLVKKNEERKKRSPLK